MSKELKIIGTEKFINLELDYYNSFENPLFLASDVAKILQERDGYTVARKVNESEKATHFVCTPGGVQSATFLTEFGLYEIAMKSEKSKGIEFRKYVKEVLESIRKNGYHVDKNITDEQVEKLQAELAERNSMLRKVFGVNLKTLSEFVDIINQNTNQYFGLNELYDLLKELKWLDNEMEITRRGSTRKLIKYNGQILISEYGRRLALDNMSRKKNRRIAKL